MAASGIASGKPLHELSVIEATAAMAAGAFTAQTYVEALLERQQAWRPLNAYTQQDVAAVRAAARRAARIRSPVSGLPIAVKDNIDVAGYFTTAGTPALARHAPKASAPLVQALIDQGAVVTGKVGLHEMAAGGTCANIPFGQIRNPYNLGMVPGGSSGGSAAAVAAGLVPASIGSDTAGSVRAPAAYSGCVGFKPTSGRYSRIGLVAGDIKRDTMGWLVRQVADAEYLDAVAAPGPAIAPVTLQGLRLGVPRGFFYAGLDPDVAKAVEAALAKLADAGVELIEADVPGVGDLLAQLGPVARDLAGGLGVYLAESGAAVTPEEIVHAIADPQLRAGMTATLAAQAAAPAGENPATAAMKQAYAGYFAGHGVAAVIFPTSPEMAYPVPADIAAGGTGPISMIRNTLPGAHACIPGLSIPAGLTSVGLPIGIELDGPSGSDLTLLKIGRAIEALLPPIPAPQLPG
jgi:mandelamide amidase